MFINIEMAEAGYAVGNPEIVIVEVAPVQELLGTLAVVLFTKEVSGNDG